MSHAIKPRRILMTTSALASEWSSTLELANALCRLGMQVGIATMGPPLPALARDAIHNYPGITLFESRFRLEWMSNPWGDVHRSAQWLLDLESRFAPDVFHLSSLCHGNLTTTTPRVVLAHGCLLSWWKNIHEDSWPPRLEYYRRQAQAAIHQASAVILPTSALALDMRRHYGLEHHEVIYPGIDTAAWKPARKESLIMAAGNYWSAAFNHQSLEKLASLVDWPVMLASEVRSPEDHPGGCQEGTVVRPRHCRLVGPPDYSHLQHWLPRAAIFIHLTKYDPVATTVLQAAASGCALILQDTPNLRQQWGEAAIYTKNNNEGDLYALTKRLMLDEKFRAVMGQRARSRACTYRLDETARKFSSVYGRLTEQRQGTSVDPTKAALRVMK